MAVSAVNAVFHDPVSATSRVVALPRTSIRDAAAVERVMLVNGLIPRDSSSGCASVWSAIAC
ncbi:MAG TPA: hypothetical protein VKE51_15270 [Vicinamibacterales bacterium]|nr:hypothetical protein [Vicinamibacterales bacterium]